ncbi:restriction endonuclease subunit S, partial [Enterobacter asburiae]
VLDIYSSLSLIWRYSYCPVFQGATSHWNVKPTFSCCDASTTKNTDGLEYNVLSLSYGKIVSRDIDSNYGLLPESFNTYQLVDKGDTILRLTDLQNDKKSLRVGLVTQKGIITSAYLKLAVKKYLTPVFLYQILHSYDTMKVFYSMGNGLRQSMKFEDFRRLPLLIPTIPEQYSIITFLNHKITKIDQLIKKQYKLIELLKEKRQAVISHAVTKGLNPDVPMKDSGVEWLGNIPEHWILKRAKFIFRKMQRPISKHAGIITAFRDGHVTLRQNRRTDGFTFAIKEIGYQGVLKGDLVIHAMDGFAGAIGVSDSNGKCSPVCSVCIPHKKTQVYTSYYGYLVRQLAVTNFIQSLSKGIRERSTEFRFNEFSELTIPIPNYEEQIFIFKYIKRQGDAANLLI